jgi:hypothetical protein
MKTNPVLFTLVAAFALTSAVLLSAPATADTPARGSHERVDLKVLKVFSAKDGEAIFRAYVVEWKGQEVVVSDSLAKTRCQVDDTISVLVMKNPFPQGKEPYDLLHFTILPPPGNR